MTLRFKGNIKPSDVLKKGSGKIINSKRTYAEMEESNYEGDIENSIKERKATDSFKTPAELTFELVRKKRSMDRIQKKLELSHKEKVEKFNNKLSKLSDHFDIPRVGPG